MLVFVTGVAGSGKSTLCSHLMDRGLPARDADDGISRHVRRSDGAEVATPPREHQTREWADEHEFRFNLESVSRLAARAATLNVPVFLLGAAYGDAEVVKMADVSFYLDLEEGELRRRLARRTEESYGYQPFEFASVLAWHAAAAKRYEALGAMRLEGARPVGQVTDELLSRLPS